MADLSKCGSEAGQPSPAMGRTTEGMIKSMGVVLSHVELALTGKDTDTERCGGFFLLGTTVLMT